MSLCIDESKTCPECVNSTLIIDHSAGDLVCTGCGLVLQGQCLDGGNESRSFGSDCVESGPKVDSRARADFAGAADEITGDLGCTGISGGDAMALTLQRAMRQTQSTVQTAANAGNSKLKSYVHRIRDLSSQMNLSESIIGRCIELLKHLADNNELPRMQVAWINAIVYLACREDGVGRTVRELARVSSRNISQSEESLDRSIQRCVNKLSRPLEPLLTKAVTRDIQPEERMPRFVSRLQLAPEVGPPAIFIVQQANRYQLTPTRNQSAVIAAAVYIVAWLLDVQPKPKVEEVAVIAGVPVSSVRGAYGDLRGYMERLLPDYFVIQLSGGIAALPVERKGR